VSEYRLYFMDCFSGHIESRHDFVAATDDEAINLAAGRRNDQPMELWQRARKIERWEAVSPLDPLYRSSVPLAS
jgi:hypothetical protein